jgi:hypothetical protein
MSKLTEFQERLINEMTKEFKELNEKNLNSNKFNLAKIQNCIDEENNFKKVIFKHNLKMIDSLNIFMLNEFKDFEKEFGEVIDIDYNFIKNPKYHENTLKSFIDGYKQNPLVSRKSTEINLYFKSKVISIPFADERFNYFDNAKYFKIHIDFKFENVGVQLFSGKIVQYPKIIGLQYNTNDWLRREHGNSYSSLNEMIQMHKEIQRQIVALVH